MFPSPTWDSQVLPCWVRSALVLSRAAICKELLHSLANTSPISPFSSFKTLGWVPSLSAIYLYLVCTFLWIRPSASNPWALREDEAGNVSNSFLVPPIQCQMFSRSPRRESLQQGSEFLCTCFLSLCIQRKRWKLLQASSHYLLGYLMLGGILAVAQIQRKMPFPLQ